MNHFEKTNCATHIAFLGIVIVGLILIIAGQVVEIEVLSISIGPLLANMGAFIAVIGIAQWMYDHFLRQKFFTDVSDTILKSQSVRDSGIVHFSKDSTQTNYDDYILKSERAVFCFLYSTRIIKNNFNALRERGANNLETKICHLTPEGHAIQFMSEDTVAGSAWSVDHIKIHLSEIDDLVKQIKNVKIYKHDKILKYSFILFDSDAFIILSTNSTGRETVPVLHIRKPSPLFAFIERDFDKLSGQMNDQ